MPAAGLSPAVQDAECPVDPGFRMPADIALPDDGGLYPGAPRDLASRGGMSMRGTASRSQAESLRGKSGGERGTA